MFTVARVAPAGPRCARARREDVRRTALRSSRVSFGCVSRDARARASTNEVVSALATSSGALETARAIAGAATIALVLLQGPKGDGVVNSLNEGRVFGSASQAKSAVDYATYFLIGGFILLSGVLAASG